MPMLLGECNRSALCPPFQPHPGVSGTAHLLHSQNPLGLCTHFPSPNFHSVGSPLASLDSLPDHWGLSAVAMPFGLVQ